MKLLTNETEILKSNNDSIVLTNQRVFMTDSKMGQSYSINIFLEDISSIETKYDSQMIFLILSVFSIIGGIIAQIEVSYYLLFGAVFAILWWITRKHVISISSNGGSKLSFQVQGMNDESIKDFVYKVSLAKLNRINQLNSVQQNT